jgi:hypothetical protein
MALGQERHSWTKNYVGKWRYLKILFSECLSLALGEANLFPEWLTLALGEASLFPECLLLVLGEGTRGIIFFKFFVSFFVASFHII